jgi:hypothetical protein
MSDLKRLLNPNDAEILSETAGISWVPKKPREVLLPYMPNESKPEVETDLDNRRQKGKQVVDGYTKIVEDCKRLEAEIEEKCKDVKIPLDRKKHLRVIEAIGRIFGLGQAEEITFDMYKTCIRELAKIANDTGAPDDGI